MKLLSAQQVREWDAYTIANEPVSSLELMERAALQCTEWIVRHGLFSRPLKIICGKGNNGGDGLAIARQLIQRDVHPEVYILEFGNKGSDDFQANLQSLHRLTKAICFIQSPELFPEISDNDVVVDALFGSGLNRPLAGLSASLVNHINESGATVISIDV
ncbi:MAG TPA: NAD(P)H-hydrate epimerase, partial [Chitinophagaceae bacterium]